MDEVRRYQLVALLLGFMLVVGAVLSFTTVREAAIYEKNVGWFELVANGTMKIVPGTAVCGVGSIPLIGVPKFNGTVIK